MPLCYWQESFQTSVYLINMLPSTVQNSKSPYFVLFGKYPDYASLESFGCACYPNLRPYNPHKLKCVYLGISSQHKGYRCLSSIGRIYISRYVVFNENKFPFKQGFLNTKQAEQIVTSPSSMYSLSTVEFPLEQQENCTSSFPNGSACSSNKESIQGPDSSTNFSSHSPTQFDQNVEVVTTCVGASGTGYIPVSDEGQLEIDLDLPVAKTVATNQPPIAPNRLSDDINRPPVAPSGPYGVISRPPVAPSRPLVALRQPSSNTSRPPVTISQPHELNALQNDRTIVTKSKNGISKPRVSYIGVVTPISNKSITEYPSLSVSEPQSLTEALSTPQWKKVMEDEFNALKKNKTWSLVTYNSDLRVVYCKLIFKTKFKANGEVERFMVRLVAKGFQQDL